MGLSAQRTGGWCEPVRQLMCITHPRAARPNGRIRAGRVAPLQDEALLEAIEDRMENRRSNQGGTA